MNILMRIIRIYEANITRVNPNFQLHTPLETPVPVNV